MHRLDASRVQRGQQPEQHDAADRGRESEDGHPPVELKGVPD